MKGLLLPVSVGASALRHELDALTYLEDLVRKAPEDVKPDHIKNLIGKLREVSAPAARHEFYYRATVVSLYGLLEQFIENLLIEVVQRLCQIAPRYDVLPENIRANHLPLTLEVLARLSTGKYQGKANERTLVKGLHSCYADGDAFILNDIVFAYHTANYRAEVIRQSFERIGVRLEKLDSESLLRDSMSTHFPDERNLFFVIDDLAERRNEVAHGSISQLLSIDLLHSYIDVIEAYSASLMHFATSWLIKFAIPIMGSELGRPSNVFRHKIAGYASSALPIAEGDVIAIVDGGSVARCTIIRSLMVGNKPVSSAPAGSSVGIDTCGHLTARCRLFLLPSSASFFVSE